MTALWQDVTAHDPLDPPLDGPTPPEVVATLTRPQREQRVAALIDQAWQIVDLALTTHQRGRRIVARCVMFSGGNDSTVGAHLFRDYASHLLHADTGTGVAETQQYVRETAEAWGIPLVIRQSPDTYRDLVLGRIPTAYPGGFPGRGGHGVMFTRLKERAWDLMRREDVRAHRTRELRVFLSFRRRAESERRMQAGQVPLSQHDGSVVWISPLANWTKLDMNTYRLMTGDVPVNQVSDHLHMSGECLCGAYGTRAELGPLEAFYPEAADNLYRLEHDAAAAGIDGPTARWGHGLRGAELVKARRAWLCGKCETAPADQLVIPGTGAA